MSSPLPTGILQAFRSIFYDPHHSVPRETMPHPGAPASPRLDLVLAIPMAPKCVVWFTQTKVQETETEKDICCFLHLGPRDRSGRETIQRAECIPLSSNDYATNFGTMIYGSWVRDRDRGVFYFAMEYILQYQGESTKGKRFLDILICMKEILENLSVSSSSSPHWHLHFRLPVIWERSKTTQIPKINYRTHHYQFRSSLSLVLAPMFISFHEMQKSILSIDHHHTTTIRNTLSPPQPQIPHIPHKTQIFEVSADLQQDVYFLTGRSGGGGGGTTTQLACIPDFKTSVFMNTLFRNIRENQDLNALENSDDDEEFENTQLDRFVDLNKRLWMECQWHPKFHRWIPFRVCL